MIVKGLRLHLAELAMHPVWLATEWPSGTHSSPLLSPCFLHGTLDAWMLQLEYAKLSTSARANALVCAGDSSRQRIAFACMLLAAISIGLDEVPLSFPSV